MEETLLDEVFVQTGYPKYTYVEREEVDVNMKTALRNRGIHILLHGMSKSGKSSLWQKYLDEKDYIKPIRLNDKTTLESLYNDILFKTETYYNSEIERSSESEIKAKKGFSTDSIGMKFEIESMKKTLEKINANRVASIKYNINLLIECLKTKKPRIILEDFHFATDEFIREFAKDLKSLSDEKIQVIIVGVENKARMLRDAVPTDDLNRKILEIEVGYFEDKYLEQIIDLGSDKMNIKVSKPIVNRIVSESYNKAYATQNICLMLCELEDIHERCVKEYSLNNEEILYKSCKFIAKQSTMWQGVIDVIGSREHGSDKLQTYKWILKFIHETKVPKEGIEIPAMNKIVRQMGGNGISDTSLRQSVLYIIKMLNENNLDLVISYKNKRMYIDEEFQFYVRWSDDIVSKYISKL